jgi:lysophospholipid acyltransferase (LPLAT)-like uncharacterized protein
MFLKPLKKRFVTGLGPWLAYWTIRVLGRAVHLEVINPETPGSLWERGIPFIIAFWHARLLMMHWAYRGKNVSFLISFHRDGQIIGKAGKLLGHQPIVGSTTRKGFSAFKNMIKALQNGSDVAVTPDGPRGPRYKAQIGVIELSRITGRPIVPVTFSASKKIVFNSWDRFVLPYPFSRGVFIWGEPIHVDPKGDRTHLEEKRLLLENRLNEMTEQADHYFETKFQKSKFQSPNAK